jgi:hypothetical protein
MGIKYSLTSRSHCSLYVGNNGARNCLGHEPMHATATLTIFSGVASPRGVYIFVYHFFPTTGRLGELGQDGHRRTDGY